MEDKVRVAAAAVSWEWCFTARQHAECVRQKLLHLERYESL